jgi:hypothetical protein
MKTPLIMMLTFGLAGSWGCKTTDDTPTHEPAAAQHSTPTNRIDIPPGVRQNLGITFVEVERRPVRRTVRLPGQFELKPDARREYHVMLPGRIDLLVEQFAEVQAGDPLFRVDSAEWQRLKSDLAAALNDMRKSHAELAVAEAKYTESTQAIAFTEQRIAKLADANVRQVQLEAELATARNGLPRLEAEVEAARTGFDAAHINYDVLISTAMSITGLQRPQLDWDHADHGHTGQGAPPWQEINLLTVHAEAKGVVDVVAVTHRGWAETGGLIVTTVNPANVRFHADALQTDIGLFIDGQEARIAPPQGGTIDLQDTADGRIQVGYQAHVEQRTLPILVEPTTIPKWAKPGVTAYLEVFVSGDSKPVLAIPEAAVIRDGLDMIFFRRDPADPNKVIRTAADLGLDDGRWVEVLSEVQLGDEIVLGGVYPLMLASSTSGQRTKGGHFHADGTFHAGHGENE